MLLKVRDRLGVWPTKFFFPLLLVMGAMAAATATYQSNAAWLIVLVIGSVAINSLLHARRSLRFINVSGAATPPVFAGDEILAHILVENTGKLTIFGLHISFDKFDAAAIPEIRPGQRVEVAVLIGTRLRGVWSLDKVRLSTEWPLGLLRAWRNLPVTASGIVYPKPEGAEQLPETAGSDGTGDRGKGGAEDFHGHRRYRLGDSQRHVDWKAVARGRAMLVKLYKGGGGPCWLDFEDIATPDFEARLSQLTRWVLEAERQGLKYGVRLPKFQAPPAHGSLHRNSCLRAMAFFPNEDRGARSA